MLFWLLTLALLPACVRAANPAPQGKEGQLGVKNLILLIGDGMGPQQIGLLTTYAHQAADSKYRGRQTAIEQAMRDGVLGLVRTAPQEVLVTDSAAAATQLATGIDTGAEMVGIDRAGRPVETILEKARAVGKAVGLVTDTRLTHGTPAAFATHRPHRSEENEIAAQMVAAGVDVLLGAGLRHWIPQQATAVDGAAAAEVRHLTERAYDFSSRRLDNRNLLLEARLDGYQLAFNRRQLQQVKSGKVLGIFGNESLADALAERAAGKDRQEPSLAEMTRKALELLSQRKEGFFLMVEAGQIDWACHNNDAGALLAEMLRMDEALAVILRWMAHREDTLLVVTADHETGAFGFSYSGSDLPAPRKLPGSAFPDTPHAPDFNFGRVEVLDRLDRQKESYYTIFRKFDALPAEQQTPATLRGLVAEAVPFPLTEQQAAAILKRGPNPLYVKNHRYLGNKTSPQIGDFTDFYVFGDNLRMNLLARAVAADQNVVWGTGTHTSTPVVVVAVGPEGATRPFGRMMHATELGQLMQSALLGR
jgi:alkaline phosphatase